ncbi:MAG: UDP-3-O-acyl-N-acetylglucosamine deacetylase, partial [Fimbriimonadales bacterium]|nr:UDP-3-O-acyl-N-acetylglucosamine deacetylase [Fimbriimonadales bacterium]
MEIAAISHTLRETLYFEGTGLHTGERCRIALHPLAPASGKSSRCQILVRKGDARFPARWDYVVDTTRATVLGSDGVKVSTVEHLMAALWMTGMTHCVIEVLQGSEIPILDGSALPFVEAIVSANASAVATTAKGLSALMPSPPAPLSHRVGEGEAEQPSPPAPL